MDTTINTQNTVIYNGVVVHNENLNAAGAPTQRGVVIVDPDGTPAMWRHKGIAAIRGGVDFALKNGAIVDDSGRLVFKDDNAFWTTIERAFVQIIRA